MVNNRFSPVQLPSPSAGITQIRLCGYDLRLESEPPHLKSVLFIYQGIKCVKRRYHACYLKDKSGLLLRDLKDKSGHLLGAAKLSTIVLHIK